MLTLYQLLCPRTTPKCDHPASSALCVSIPGTLVKANRTFLTTTDSYELLQWEEHQMKRRGQIMKRELEWQNVTREIALLNKPYSRS